MRKEFNDTGLCVSNKHFMVNTTNKIDKTFLNYIERGKYFTINRSRQFGKTTTISLLVDFLEKREDYLLIRTSFEGLDDNFYASKKNFSVGFLQNLHHKTYLKDKKLAQIFLDASKIVHTFNDLSAFITNFTKQQNKKIVIIIDEVDKSTGEQVFLHFLGLLRDKYLLRNDGDDYTFHSVILAGVHDIKTLKPKLRPNEVRTLNSPWNIAADFTIDMSFKAPEIVTMLDDYTNTTGLTMDKKTISERIFYYTNGYPYLVSKLCKFIDEDIISERENKNWTINDVEKAFKMLVNPAYTTTLFDSMTKNLEHYNDLYKKTFDIAIIGKKMSFTIANPIINLGHTYGIFGNKKGLCQIHNRIFEQRIYDYMLSKAEDSGDRYNFHENYFIEDGLNFKFILQRFSEFLKENYSDKDDKFYERQGRLLFLSFIKPIINGTGFDFKEPTVGDERRMDLVITYNSKRYVVELKIWRGDYYHQKGLQQLSDYLDYYSLKEGFLLIYNFNKKKEFKEKNIKFADKEIFAVWV